MDNQKGENSKQGEYSKEKGIQIDDNSEEEKETQSVDNKDIVKKKQIHDKSGEDN